MIPIEDLTDVTLAIQDTDKDDEGDEDDEEDLTDVTLVSDDTYSRLDWCYVHTTFNTVVPGHQPSARQS